jgi:tetratricopeptide (TPR) repeat protein
MLAELRPLLPRVQHRLDRADARYYERATVRAPEWSVPWYNLGLARKLQRRWPESLAANLRAIELDDTDEAAWWNAGIAATALGDWETARLAWTGFGIELPPGESEIVMGLGPTPIRINPDGNGEVVWCRRIDPARAIIQNVPLPESGHRYGDLLLHDGAPNGTRQWRGQEAPVFDALALLQPSSYATYAVQLRATNEADILALAELAEERELGVEDWDTIRSICRACSTGSPAPHDPVAPYADGQLVTLAIAARGDEELRAVLGDWSQRHPASKVVGITLLVSSGGTTHS